MGDPTADHDAGVSDIVSQVLVGEIGTDMGRFPIAGHLVSWAGLRPRMDQSAGKRRSTRIRHGAPWLKAVLVQPRERIHANTIATCARSSSASRAGGGAKKASMAVAASMLTAAYYMLRDGIEYRDLGAGHFDRRDRIKVANRLIRPLEELGLKVQVETTA